MLRAAIYARISDDREGSGLGVARQEADCRALADQRSMTVVGVYVDNDLSAYSGKRRPQYEMMLDAIADGELDAVLVWHTDRLHRSPIELERYITACEDRSVPTITVQAGTLDLTTPAGRMMARQLGIYARYESEHKSERAKRKALEIAQAGRPSGGIRAYGYDRDRLTVRTDEAAVITEVAGRVLAGGSLRSVARDLNERHVATVTGVPWSPVTLRAMLVGARLAGLRGHRGVAYPATWPAVLPMDVHLALVALLTDPARRRGPSGRAWLLSGLICCGECDRPMTTHSAGPSRALSSRTSYVCQDCHLYGAALGCDERVIAIMLKRLQHPAFAGKAAPEVDGQQDEQIVADGQARLVEIGKTWANDPTMNPDVVRALSGEVQQRVDHAKARMAGRGSRRAAPIPRVSDRHGWDALGLDVQRALVTALTTSLKLTRPTRVRRAFDPERVVVV